MPIASHFSIRLLMAVVLLIAADFGIVRGLWGSKAGLDAAAVVILPLANLLLLLLPRLRRRDEARAFWVGFEAVGWLAALLAGLLFWSYKSVFSWPILMLYKNGWMGPNNSYLGAKVIVFTVLLYTPPQILAAWIGGRLTTRYWPVPKPE